MPASTALFGSTGRSHSKNLLEFKAGKMSMKGKTVYPDKRKGLVYIFQSDDSLMHFCWKDRSSGTVEDDLIIFPDDIEFKHVPQCTTGRVYLLKFKSSSRKFFFWVQEPESDKDEENCRKVNEILNNPPALGSQRSGGATPDCDLQNLLSNMSQQQLMQLFGGVGQISGLSNLLSHINRPSSSGGSAGPGTPASVSSGTVGTGTPSAPSATPAAATAAAAAAAPTTPATPVDAAPPPNTTPAAPTKPVAVPAAALIKSLFNSVNETPKTGQRSNNPVDLASSITPESLGVILNDPKLVEKLEQHLPSLGEGCQPDQLKSTLSSPQFQQAVSMFSSALESGQLGPLVSQFELGDEAVSAAAQGNMEEFVKALQAACSIGGNTAAGDHAEQPPPQTDSTDDKNIKKKDTSQDQDKPDDDTMSLD